MRWQNKARIQNLVSRLPERLSHSVYYVVQRRFGALRRVNPVERLRSGLAMLDHAGRQGGTPQSAAFLEIGTGRRLNVPIALWLGGAARITTVDIHPYLKAELVMEDLAWIKDHAAETEELFSDYRPSPVFRERFQRLLTLRGGLEDLLRTIQTRYLPSADARRLPLPDGSVDCHVSGAVLEHIPAADLKQILGEGKRLLRRRGRMIHFVDFGDHFAPQDPDISAINFLRFDERQWQAHAGNRYMYHNRLRVDDMVELFRDAGLCARVVDPDVDLRSLRELREGFPLDTRFADKSPEANATATAWIVAAAEPSPLPLWERVRVRASSGRDGPPKYAFSPPPSPPAPLPKGEGSLFAPLPEGEGRNK